MEIGQVQLSQSAKTTNVTHTVQETYNNRKKESGLSLDFLLFLFISLFLVEPLSYFRWAEIVLILSLVLKRCSFI